MVNAGGLALPEKVGRSREGGPIGDCLVVIDRQRSKDGQAEGKHGGLGSGRRRGTSRSSGDQAAKVGRSQITKAFCTWPWSAAFSLLHAEAKFL